MTIVVLVYIASRTIPETVRNINVNKFLMLKLLIFSIINNGISWKIKPT